MPRFSANLSLMFTELPFLDRFSAAADAGFEGVEFMFPYAHDADDIRARLDATGLKLVLFNLSPGNWEQGDRGLAIFPNAVEAFRDSVRLAERYAVALDCKALHCLAGVTPTGVERSVLRKTYVDNLKFAADALSQSGTTLLIEPINTRDIPSYFLDGTAMAADIIESVDAANLRMQFDIYHMQIMQGDIITSIARYLPLIGHIQIADNPGRGEPGSGEINFPFLFKAIDALGYKGWIGCEYRPRTSTHDSLAWFREFRAAG